MEKDFPFLKLFDDLIISGNEKMIKPNKEIYNKSRLTYRLSYSKRQSSFKIPINTAQKLGFTTINLISFFTFSEIING